MTDMMAEIAAFDGRTAKIVGPARSGKTEALLRRAAAAVAAGCAPEDILIETSTAEAARVARRRLVDALAAAGKLTEELRLKKEELGKAHEGGAT